MMLGWMIFALGVAIGFFGVCIFISFAPYSWLVKFDEVLDKLKRMMK